MKTPLKAGLVLLVSAVVILGGALLIRGPLLEEEKGSVPTSAGSAQPVAIAAGADENGGFAGLAARTVKKGGSGANGDGTEIVLAEVEGSRAREDYINATFRPLAGLGVDVAMARVRELPDEASRDMAMLALLGEWSGQSVTELAQRAGMRKQAMATLVKQCEAWGMVLREGDAHDARARRVCFTPTGLAWLAAYQESVAQAEAELRYAVGEEVATVVALGLEAYAAAA